MIYPIIKRVVQRVFCYLYNYLKPRRDIEEMWYIRVEYLGPRALYILVYTIYNIEIEGIVPLNPIYNIDIKGIPRINCKACLTIYIETIVF